MFSIKIWNFESNGNSGDTVEVLVSVMDLLTLLPFYLKRLKMFRSTQTDSHT